MSNFISIAKEYIKKHNPNWPEIPDYTYKILIVGGRGSEKTNALLNLISHQSNKSSIWSKISTDN